MRHIRRLLFVTSLLALPLFATTAQAQPASDQFTFGLMVGVGDGLDSASFNNTSFQALFGLDLANNSRFTVRLGQVDLDQEIDEFFPQVESELQYLTLSTEYTISADFYDSGVYIGLGFYDLQSNDGLLIDDSALGLNIGVTGDFQLTSIFSAVVEFSGHYADLDIEQFFLMAHAGLAVRF